MMDLTRKSLPNTVCVGGRDFSVYTDYRLWMKFEMQVSKLKRGDRLDISYLFKNEVPICSVEDLFQFSRPKNILPRHMTGNDDVIALDYEIDSDLIYSAFLGQYGIDLVDIEELHWHKFLALLSGINDATRLREVIGYRCYKKENRKDIDLYEEMKQAWTIEQPISEEEAMELDDFNKSFGG